MLKPLGKNILIRELPIDRGTGGIAIPDEIRFPHLRGTVLDVGPKVRDVTVSDTVYFSRHGFTITVEGSKYFLLKEEDLLAIESK